VIIIPHFYAKQAQKAGAAPECLERTMYMCRMKIPAFKSEDQEAEWLYANRKQIERELRAAEKAGSGLNVQEIIRGLRGHRKSGDAWRGVPAEEKESSY